MNPNKIRILIADDHELYLDGLHALLKDHPLYEIIGQACNGEELVSKAVSLKPQLVLTDLKMPLLSGAAAIHQMLQVNPQLACMVLTSYENDLSIIEALEAGARGYMTKNIPKKDLFAALDQVIRGYPYYCYTTSTKMVRLIGRSRFNPYNTLQRTAFSETENKIIHLVCEEKDNKEIADLLFMSIRTVENNRSRILKKMNVKTTAGVAIYAIKNGMYFLEDS
ncbi:MAG: response regulator transcription factor [Bacteroidota bacterium]